MPAVVSAAACLAAETVAVSKGAISKAPSGPFQTSVVARDIQALTASTVFGQHDGAAGRGRLDHDLLGGVGEIMLAERLADIGAARGKEGVRHAAADDERVDLLDEVGEQVELG